MGRKKKEDVPLVVPDLEQMEFEIPGEKPVEKKAEEPVEKPKKKKREKKAKKARKEDPVTTQMEPVVITQTVPVVITEAFLKKIRADALEWAIECGLVGAIHVTDPVKVDYPKCGYGFSVGVREETGKQRQATARFTSAGVKSYWSMDGKVVI